MLRKKCYCRKSEKKLIKKFFLIEKNYQIFFLPKNVRKVEKTQGKVKKMQENEKKTIDLCTKIFLDRWLNLAAKNGLLIGEF